MIVPSSLHNRLLDYALYSCFFVAIFVYKKLRLFKSKTVTKAQQEQKDFEVQLFKLERMRQNLITLVGYELWTPLSTIQACLESLVNFPELSLDSRQSLANMALSDLDRLRKLIQDFLLLSQLENESANFNCHLIQQLENILQQTLKRILKLCQEELSLQLCLLEQDIDERNTAILSQLNILEYTQKNLIAIVGHELRTPLCSIQVCLECLIGEPIIPIESRENMLEIAMGDIERLKRVIKDFFILSRLKSGYLYNRPEYIKLDDAIDLAASGIKKIQNSGYTPEIIIDIPSELPQIKVDGDKLVEVLIKLLDNACKFTESLGLVKIQARILDIMINDGLTELNMLKVVITDNGRGIEPNNLEAIFQDFYQEENHLRRTVNGTGIGLTICRKIIQSFGGYIWAESAGKNQGSSLCFTIPLVSN
jgi:signal transduction histidine kinase